jgi:hypothetical protein
MNPGSKLEFRIGVDNGSSHVYRWSKLNLFRGGRYFECDDNNPDNEKDSSNCYNSGTMVSESTCVDFFLLIAAGLPPWTQLSRSQSSKGNLHLYQFTIQLTLLTFSEISREDLRHRSPKLLPYPRQIFHLPPRPYRIITYKNSSSPRCRTLLHDD